MSTASDGPGQREFGCNSGKRVIPGVRRRAGAGRAAGSALIAVAAWLLALTGGGGLSRKLGVCNRAEELGALEALGLLPDTPGAFLA